MSALKFKNKIMRGGVSVAHESHKLKVVGSIPTPAPALLAQFGLLQSPCKR